MNSLITVSKMTSMQIAEVTNKQHPHIMRDIRDEIEKLEAGGIEHQSKFGLVKYTDAKGEERPYYQLTKEGVLQLAARYDAVARAKLIEMAMKNEEPDSYMIADPIERAKRWIHEQEEKRLLQAENKLLSQQTLTWTNRKVLEAIVKAYGASIHIPDINGFQEAWKDFKKELLYNYSININLRISKAMETSGRKTKPKTLSMIHDDELPKCISTAVALCKSHNVDISEIISKYRRREAV